MATLLLPPRMPRTLQISVLQVTIAMSVLKQRPLLRELPMEERFAPQVTIAQVLTLPSKQATLPEQEFLIPVPLELTELRLEVAPLISVAVLAAHLVMQATTVSTTVQPVLRFVTRDGTVMLARP